MSHCLNDVATTVTIGVSQGGGNTPYVSEGYYRVPSCGASTPKIFGLPAKVENTLV
jgi:hypothetical protein